MNLKFRNINLLRIMFIEFGRVLRVKDLLKFEVLSYSKPVETASVV